MDMQNEWTSGVAALLAGGAVVVTLLPWLIGDGWANRHVRRMTRIGQGSGWLALVLALAAVVLLVVGGGGGVGGVLRPLVYFDGVSAAMLVMVTLLGAVIQRYAASYLGGDARQGSFVRWLSLTLASVQLVVVAGHLVVLFGAWLATSYGLHRLLVYYGDRPGAVLAARKKFVVSRLGDLCLVGALVLIASQWGTLHLEELVQVEHSGAAGAQSLGWAGHLIALLLAGAALLKSAQLPFHTWLPETMETPTPVSALMHAGIINAGGFLVIRLSALVAPSVAALHLLAVVGALTAVGAAVIMLTQTSIKKSLAYSTISQMGFMLMQCGLGAFSMALLHILAHSLYKAHAFLRSGSVVAQAQAGRAEPAFGGARRAWPYAFVLAVAVVLAYQVLYRGADALFGAYVAEASAVRPGGWVIGALVAGLFALSLALQWAFTRGRRSAWLQSLHIHASNGFYLGTLATRMINRMWPVARG